MVYVMIVSIVVIGCIIILRLYCMVCILQWNWCVCVLHMLVLYLAGPGQTGLSQCVYINPSFVCIVSLPNDMLLFCISSCI